jgi:hypothetical protein
METVLIVAAPCLALATLYCLWRAAHLFVTWRPAAASVVDSDYDEGQQQEDFWIGNSLLTSRGFSFRDGEHARLIEDRILFEDAHGERHCATVKRRVRRGWRPWSVYIVWYDPEAPGERVTVFGPGYWLLMAMVWGCLLALLFATGIRAAGVKG